MKSPLKVAELDHVVLRCADREKALGFYTGVLGLTEERRIQQIGLVQLRAGRSMLDLVPATGSALAQDARNVDHFCLGIETADINQVVEYLKANSVEVLGEPAIRYGARGSGLSIYVRDPEGNVVELKQLPKET